MKRKTMGRAAALLMAPVLCWNASVTAFAALGAAKPCCYLGDAFAADPGYRQYSALYQELLQICEEVDASYADYTFTPATSGVYYDDDMIVEVAFTFSYEHPEYFWLGNRISYGSSGVSFSVAEDFQNGAARQAAKEQIASEVDGYLRAAAAYDSKLDKAMYFHDALIEAVDYEEGDNDQNIASVFLEGKTVCAGYAAAYNLLCNAVGIDAVTIVGMAHAWNAVRFGEYWFLTDVTFDEGMGDYTFYALSDEEMRELDEWDGTVYEVEYTDENGDTRTMELYEHDKDVTMYHATMGMLPKCPITYAEFLELLASTPGDVDMNGNVDAVDASLILYECALRGNGSPGSFDDETMARADYDGNGEMNATDASLVLIYAAKTGNGAK